MRCKAGEQQDPSHAVTAELEQQHVEKGGFTDCEQRLWRLGREGAQPCPETTAQNYRLSDRHDPARGNKHSATSPQMICPAVICTCWISGVESEGTCKHRWQRAAISPPVLPVKPTIVSRFSRPALIAREMFGERLEVEIAIRTSPGQPRPRICRSNTLS